MPPGKPDPSELAIPQGEFRRRIIQHAQKGPTCLKSAMDRIRPRIGRRFSQELEVARKNEQYVSLYRKKVSGVSLRMPTLLEAMEKPEVKDFLQKVTPLVAKTFIKNWADTPLFRIEESFRAFIVASAKDPAAVKDPIVYKYSKEELENFVEDSQGCSNFYEFLTLRQKTLKLGPVLELISNSGFDPDKLVLDTFNFFKVPDELRKNPLYKASIIERIGVKTIIALYNLKLSNLWNPELGVKNLIQALRKEGPCVCGGDIGLRMHVDLPQRSKRDIEGKSLFYWPKGAARRAASEVLGHAIVVIGAEVNEDGKEFVYYNDPQDESDPKDPDAPKTYVISYDSFAGAVTPLFLDRRQLSIVNPSWSVSGSCAP